MNNAQKKTPGGAVASLILGILGFILIGPLGSIPAIICGHVAKSKIRRNPELAGEGLALAGLILGYVQVGLMIVMLPLLAAIAVPSFQRAREMAQQSTCINALRQIEVAKEQWARQEDKREGDTVDVMAVQAYLPGARECPAGGEYHYKRIGEQPVCSVHGDALGGY